MQTKYFAAVFLISGTCSISSGQLFETFDYANGPLTTVSGGSWELWGPNSLNANVVNGVIVDTPTPETYIVTDVIRPFDGVLTQLGQTATFGFDLNLQNTDFDFGGFAVSPATAPYPGGGQSYSQSLFIQFSPRPNTNEVSIYGWYRNEQHFQVFVELGNFPLGQWHHLSGTLSRRETGSYVDFSMSANGGNSGFGSFLMNDPRGFNAVEFWNYARGSSPSMLVDNVFVQTVPEPGTLFLMGFGIAVTRWRIRVRTLRV